MGWLVGKEGAEWGADLGRRSVKSVNGDGWKGTSERELGEYVFNFSVKLNLR